MKFDNPAALLMLANWLKDRSQEARPTYRVTFMVELKHEEVDAIVAALRAVAESAKESK